MSSDRADAPLPPLPLPLPELNRAALPEALRLRVEAANVGAQLASMIAEARRTHPKIGVSNEAFAASLLAQVPEGVDLAAHLASLRVADLLISYGCANGDREAITLFERQCFDEIPFAHARVRPNVGVDEIAQMMRDRLFVRTPNAGPKVAQYSGLGDLRGWFRVVLMRHLLNLVSRSSRRETDLDDAMLEVIPGGAADPEIEHARRLYGPALKEALVEAIAALQPRDRTLLRLAVCDGLTVDAIGSVYGVHRATAARWVAAARDQLQAGTRERLRERLGVRDESVASLLRVLASQVEISLRGHLLSQQAAPED